MRTPACLRRGVSAMYLGKQIRLERILDRNAHTTIIDPIDQGVSKGPLPGIWDMRHTLIKLA